MPDQQPDAVPDDPDPTRPCAADDTSASGPDDDLTAPVPITVWHVPAALHGAASPQLLRRLTANYGQVGTTVLDVAPARASAHAGDVSSVSLVITRWPQPDVTAGEHLRDCAQHLRPSGCLAVVVPNADIPDQLGRLVTAARAVGLTYLQHIVAVHQLAASRASAGDGRREHPLRARPVRQLRVHTDVLIFRKPLSADA
jgi:hypothetical protein